MGTSEAAARVTVGSWENGRRSCSAELGARGPGAGWLDAKEGWLGWGSVAVALCLPGYGAQGGGLLVESAGAAGRGSVPFPGSSGVDFGSQIHECEACEGVPGEGGLSCV